MNEKLTLIEIVDAVNKQRIPGLEGFAVVQSNDNAILVTDNNRDRRSAVLAALGRRGHEVVEVVDLGGLKIPENLDLSVEHLPSPFQIIDDFNTRLEKKRKAREQMLGLAKAQADEMRKTRNQRKRRHRKERGK